MCVSESVEKIFGIKAENELNFRRALTHTSYAKEKELAYEECYERLEYLGDAVLKLTVSKILYDKYPDYAEGQLSKIRSIVVSDNTLSKIAIKIGLNDLIISSVHEKKQGVNRLESVTACAFEAVLGAYYLDGKLEELYPVLKTWFEDYIEDVDKNFERFNAKAILQEYTQGKTKETPVYEHVGSVGADHNKTFSVKVYYQNVLVGEGVGKSKKDAEQHAAYMACKKLGAIANEG